MKPNTEVELKFQVAETARAALLAELARGQAGPDAAKARPRARTKTAPLTLAAQYLDTADRRLVEAGMAWRLRREGRQWMQTLKAAGASAFERFEHEAPRAPAVPHPVPDAGLHAGTPVGERLLQLLREAQAEGAVPQVVYQTQVRRTRRVVRTRGAVVEIAFDEGWLIAGAERQRIREVEFELVSGSLPAMLALTERWRQRFGLLLDPRSKAERGDRLARGAGPQPLRKAARPDYPRGADALAAFGAVSDECLTQMLRNAIGLADGDPALRSEHVHQLRVGIRRLRTALRSFRGWVAPPGAELIEGLRTLFAELGRTRDDDVLASGIGTALRKAGAPALQPLPAGTDTPDAVALVRASTTQRTLLGWLAWRATLAEAAPPGMAPGVTEQPVATEPTNAGAPGLPDTPVAQASPATAPDKPLARRAARRLQRWHDGLAQQRQAFDTLDAEALHELRKRIKRQRYAAEFFAPLLKRRAMGKYLAALAAIQDRMGELNDLAVARDRYQASVAADPAAWFALGWIAAREAALKATARQALIRLTDTDPPGPVRGSQDGRVQRDQRGRAAR